MQQVVINTSFGGFGFSEVAIRWLRAHGYEPANSVPLPGDPNYDHLGMPQYHIYLEGNPPDQQQLRTDPLVVECVRTLTPAIASGAYASLAIVEVPDDVNWHIHDYDGSEHVAENHRTWR